MYEILIHIHDQTRTYIFLLIKNLRIFLENDKKYSNFKKLRSYHLFQEKLNTDFDVNIDLCRINIEYIIQTLPRTSIFSILMISDVQGRPQIFDGGFISSSTVNRLSPPLELGKILQLILPYLITKKK